MSNSINIFIDNLHNKQLQNFLTNYLKSQKHIQINSSDYLYQNLYKKLYQQYCNQLKDSNNVNKYNNIPIEKIDLIFCQDFINQYIKILNLNKKNNSYKVNTNDNPYHQPQNSSYVNNESESYNDNNNDTMIVTDNVIRYDKDKQSTNNIIQSAVSNEPNNYNKFFEMNVPKEPIILDIPERDNAEYHIILDSRDRNVINYPYPDNFTINIENIIKNIYIIHIDRIITPNWCIFIEEPYTYISFKELDNVYIYNGSNPIYNKIFTQIYPDSIVKERKHILQIPTNSQKIFKTNTLASLTRFSPEILKSDGSNIRSPTDVFQILELLECVIDNIQFYRLKVKNIYRNLSTEYYNWLYQICKIGDIVEIINENTNVTEKYNFMTLGSLSDFLNGEFIIDIYKNASVEQLYTMNITSDKLTFYEPVNGIPSQFNQSYIFLKKISFFISLRIVVQEYNARTIPNQILI
jgi:hypothetical protein